MGESKYQSLFWKLFLPLCISIVVSSLIIAACSLQQSQATAYSVTARPVVTPTGSPTTRPLVTPTGSPGVKPAVTPTADALSRKTLARGYLTTPNELMRIAQLAQAGVEPYKTAVEAELQYVEDILNKNRLRAPKKINIKGSDIEKPAYLYFGSRYAYAYAIAYNLLRARDPELAQQYAEQAYDLIMGMPRRNTQVTSDYEQNTRLNISISLQNFVYAADLLSDWPLPDSDVPFAKSDDAEQFKEWLGTEIIRYPYNAAHTRVNNWGNWGRLTTAVIADYVGDAAPLYVQRIIKDKHGSYMVDPGVPCDTRDVKKTCIQVDAGTMYAEAIQLHFDAVNGELREFSSTSCDTEGFNAMIRPDGGIPDELRRQYKCDSGRIRDSTGSAATYSQFAVEPMVCLAELAWRRGDASIYTHIDSATGRGALYRSIQFLVENDVKLTRGSMLEIANRFYTYQLGVEQDATKREEYRKLLSNNLPKLLKEQSSWPVGANIISFGTLTHGFASDEVLRPPPTVPPRSSAAETDMK